MTKNTEHYITINPFNITEIRDYTSEESALKDSIKRNKSNPEHPSYWLYKIQESNSMYIGHLRRKFGTDDYYFSKTSYDSPEELSEKITRAIKKE